MTAATADGATRRDFLYVASGAMGAVGVAAVAWPFIDQMNPSSAALALSSVEVDISTIVEGQGVGERSVALHQFVADRTVARGAVLDEAGRHLRGIVSTVRRCPIGLGGHALEAPPPPLTFRCETRSLAALDTHVAALAVIHALAAELIPLTGEPGRARIRAIEDLHERLQEL